MNKTSNSEVFRNAYNNFDSRPLAGETLRKFYIDDFTKDEVKSIKKTVKISDKFCKMLVIGHRGCGKSTIINKVAEELSDDFHIVSFLAGETLNMNDVETIDILISIYLQLIYSMNESKINVPLQRFEDIMRSVKNKLKLTETGLNLWRTLSFMIKVENESRATLREEFRNQVEILDNGISDCIAGIYKYYQNKNISWDDINESWENNDSPSGKDTLIIIDDLDKLDTKFAEQVFFKDAHILTMPKAKIIYTFPLETYYCTSYRKHKDRYKIQYIPLIVVDRDKNGDIGIKQLERLILKRIEQQYITEEALKEIILASGGLLRDLIQFMQDACTEVIVSNSRVIDKDIAEVVIIETINDYYRLFDFPNYQDEVQKIASGLQRRDLESEKLIYLLKNLFILEYKLKGKLRWYNVHPCLKRVLRDG